MIQKFKHWAIMGFIAIVPIIYNTSEAFSQRTFQERIFQLGGMGVIALFIGNPWISGFMILNLFSLIYNDFNVGLPQVLNIFVGCALFMVSRAYFRKNHVLPYLNVLLWILCINIFWMILQSCGIDPLYLAQDAGGVPQLKTTFRDCLGLFGIKMANGIFMCITLPVLATLNVFLTPLILIPLYFCRSSVAALSVLISMGFFIYHTHRKAFIYFVLVTLVGGAVYVGLDLKDDPQTFKSRFPAWHSAVRYGFLRPLGYGPDSYRNITKTKDFLFYSDSKYNHCILTKVDADKARIKFYDMDNGKMYEKNQQPFKGDQISFWDNPHNEYVKMFFEYGFIGIFLLIGLMRDMYFRFKFAHKSKELIVITSCLLVYFVSGVGHFPLELARIACLFPLLLGAFFARTETQIG